MLHSESRWTAQLLLLLFLSAWICPAPAEEIPDNSIFIRAFAYDQGNPRVFAAGESYADVEAVAINGGVYPNFMEYEIDFPLSGRYTFLSRYAALQSRPVKILLDGKVVHEGFKEVTGSWSASSAKWFRECEIEIPKGKHTVRLERQSCIPHIVGFRLDSSKPFPSGWKLDRPNANKIEGIACLALSSGKEGFDLYVRDDGFVMAPESYNPIVPFKKVPPPTPNAHRILEFTLMDPAKYPLQARIEKGKDGRWLARLSVKVTDKRTDSSDLVLCPEHIEKMLKHCVRLIDDFRAMGKAGCLKAERDRAEKMQEDLKQLAAAQPDDESQWRRIYDVYLAAYQLKNRVALSNPLIDFDRLIFARRYTYRTSHIYTTYFDGSRNPGGNLCVLDGIRPTGKVTTIANELGEKGIFRDPDLSWDGKRVLFSFKADLKTPCRLYEVGIDGQGLRQLTKSEYDDIDPCYLPDGRIMFVSTRCRRVVLCHNAFTVSVLYTMNADGTDIRCCSPNTVNDFTPSVTADGRVVYCRWEYVDKNLGNNQALWFVNPDGTGAAHVMGAHWGPITFWEPREVPGSRMIVCTLAPHMPLACGPIALVDPFEVGASPAKYKSLTPELPPAHHFGWHRKDVGYYMNPYPLSEDYHIVCYNYGPDDRAPAGYGIYLLDRWNNRDLIYREPEWACCEPFPVKVRRRPPVRPTVVSGTGETGTFYLIDVYKGLLGIERGTVKHLRVVEEMPKPVSANCSGYLLQYPVISNGGDHALKRVLGTVPVQEDGSAFFRAPADVALYFSALDENYMEIQRMRSFTYIGRGEKVSCVGCHDYRTTSPHNTVALALRRPPSDITPPPGGMRCPDFAYDVMPILTKHCAKCHTGDKPKGGVDLSPDKTSLFNVAYETLTKRQAYVSFANLRSSENLPLRPPKHYGSHASKLMKVLMTMHTKRVKLSREDIRRIATWIDCNAPYYGTFRFTRPHTIGGRELVDAEIRKPLGKIYAKRCASCHGKRGHDRVRRIRYPNIEKSPALLAPLAKSAGGTEACKKAIFADTKDADYKAMLEVFRKVQGRVQANPRLDMLSHRPEPLDPDCNYRYR